MVSLEMTYADAAAAEGSTPFDTVMLAPHACTPPCAPAGQHSAESRLVQDSGSAHGRSSSAQACPAEGRPCLLYRCPACAQTRRHTVPNWAATRMQQVHEGSNVGIARQNRHHCALQPASSLPPLADATVSAPAQSQHKPHNTHSRSPPALTKPACSDTVSGWCSQTASRPPVILQQAASRV